MKYLYLLFCLIPQIVYSQGWVTIYEESVEGIQVEETIENDYIIASLPYSLVRFNQKGEFISEINIDEVDFTLTNFISTLDNGFLLTGRKRIENDNDAFLIKKNTTGQTIWSKKLEIELDEGGDVFYDVYEDKDSSIYGLGVLVRSSTTISGALDIPVFLQKFNMNGDSLFLQSYGNAEDFGNTFQIGVDIKKVNEDFILLSKISLDAAVLFVPFATKVNPEGELIWEKQLTSPLFSSNGTQYGVYEVANNMVVEEEMITITGLANSMEGVAPYIITADTDGNIVSSFIVEPPDSVNIVFSSKLTDIKSVGENFVILYYDAFEKQAIEKRLGFIVVSKTGEVLLQKFLGHTPLEKANKILPLEDGGFLIVGGRTDLVLVRTDSLGNCYPDTQFTTEDMGLGLYQFDNQSEYADSYLWEFGDGTTDTTSTLSHQYQAIGTYEVCLTATNLCDSFKKCRNIEVSEVTDIEVYEWEQGLLVYPNPVHNTRLFVDIPQTTELPILTLYNSFGKQILNHNSTSLDISELSTGLYYLQIQVRKETITRKILVY